MYSAPNFGFGKIVELDFNLDVALFALDLGFARALGISSVPAKLILVAPPR